MLAIERPHGRTAHGVRVEALRQLHEYNIITFRRTEMIAGRRHYIISTESGEEILLRDSDIEPYLTGMKNLVAALKGTAFPVPPGLEPILKSIETLKSVLTDHA